MSRNAWQACQDWTTSCSITPGYERPCPNPEPWCYSPWCVPHDWQDDGVCDYSSTLIQTRVVEDPESGLECCETETREIACETTTLSVTTTTDEATTTIKSTTTQGKIYNYSN
jgi:hypothetical protein